MKKLNEQVKHAILAVSTTDIECLAIRNYKRWGAGDVPLVDTIEVDDIAVEVNGVATINEHGDVTYFDVYLSAIDADGEVLIGSHCSHYQRAKLVI